MSGVNEQVVEDGVFEDVAPPCVALVPLTEVLPLRPKSPVPRPDPTFVTQLIATAEQLPQTRMLRRASPQDATSAYNEHRRDHRGAGLCTRQTI